MNTYALLPLSCLRSPLLSTPAFCLRYAVLLAVLCFIAVPSTFAQVIYVDADAAGAGTGTSWPNAFRTLQEGLGAATSGDQIWVANGTYYPDVDNGGAINTDDRTATFQLLSGVALYGGFAGGETLLSQRNFDSNPAILSGDLLQNDGGNFTGNGDNAYHVVTGSGTNNTAILDGFVITAGNANDGSAPHNRGAGIYIDNGSPTIAGNTITENSAFAGGGLYHLNGSSPAITSNTFSDNRAIGGGGGILNNGGTATVTGNTIAGNTADDGGGVFNFSNTGLITNNTIDGNTATGEGGGIYNLQSSPMLTGNTITDNIATSTGGGLFNDQSNPVVTSTILYGNTDVTGTPALSQIFNVASTPTVSYSLVEGGLSAGTTDGGNNGTNDPLLGPLQDNGGLTFTRLPAISSPAIDTGTCAGLTTDQRGESRPHDAPDATFPNTDDGCDVGAVELQAPEITICGTGIGTCYVDASASGTGNGISWTDAFTTLQEALALATNGDEIWVADGTYYPDENDGGAINTDDRTASFGLKTDVGLYGGFAGSETMRSQRNPKINVTVLSGDLMQNDGANFANNGDNAYHVVTASFSGILDGFIITAGNANSPGDATDHDNRGAGIYVGDASPTINGNIITRNSAVRGGAGLYLFGFADNPTISRNVISENRAARSGAGSGGGILASSPGATISHNTIMNNDAHAGGGIYSIGFQFITGNTIVGNAASSGAGLVLLDDASLKGNTIVDNYASYEGGGINVRTPRAPHPTITATILYGNSDGGGTDASAQIHIDSGAAPTVSYSIVQGGLSAGIIDGGNNLTADPRLLPLADNGGRTPTMLPLGSSPAIDAGTCDGQTTDQRGEPRPYDNPSIANADDACDIGAVEAQSDDPYQLVCSGICYVDATATGTGDGTSWTNAFPMLQDALFLSLSGSQIWVADGTYYPDESTILGVDSDSRNATFQLLSGVALYGGFAGGETALNQRDPATNPAILSGDLQQNDSGNFTGNGDNAFHVVSGSGTDATTILDGFTITAGNANGGGFPTDGGGGIFNEAGSPTITRSTITGNKAFRGGGVYNTAGSTPAITHNTIHGNQASDGGGIYTINSTPIITGNTIVDNTAGFGGGLYNSNSNATITGNTITGNVAGTTGGGIRNLDSNPTITATILYGNSDSGGTDASGQMDNNNSAPTVSYSIVQGGRSTGTIDGGSNLTDDPLLGLLQNNGGPTPTRLPFSNSPAIDTGTCAGQTGDQREEPRPYDDPGISNADDGCDIGAVEIQSDDDTSATCAGTCYVDASASGAGIGISWANAFTSLQDALAAAVSGDEIWVAEGTYYPDESNGVAVDTDDRNATFQLISGIALYGGFAGGETAIEQRDIVANPAILSGDLQQNDGPDFTNNGDNACHVVNTSGTDNTALLDGFTITAGNAYGCTSPISPGGGIYNEAGNATITRNTITGNNASRGGGIYITTGSTPTITQNTIVDNMASTGGGIYTTDSTPTITGNAISDNEARSGGGIYTQSSTPTITGNTISGNHAVNNGGGILATTSTTPIIMSNTIVGNTAVDGGGIHIRAGSTAAVRANTITGNSATLGGGIYNTPFTSPAITGNTIVGNNAEFGAGIYNTGTSTITSNTITGNVASDSGGGIRNFNSSPTITATILYDNSDSGGTDASAQMDNNTATPTVSYSIVQGGLSAGTVDGGNNFTDDPQLGPLQDNGGPTLTRKPTSPDSPVVDAIPADGGGKTSALGCGTSWTTDQRGEPRPADGNNDTIAACDIGAVEGQSAALLPVELVSFEALRDADRVMLRWHTAAETNNAGFEVEVREVGSEAVWQMLGFVDGAGTTTTPQDYTFEVAGLEAGRHVFRLRQVDFDGTFAYSPQVEVAVEVAGPYHLSEAYPNPFNPQTQFSLAVNRTQQVEIAVYDVRGRRVAVLFAGEMAAHHSRAFVWDAAQHPSGLYLIRVVGDRFVETRRVTLVK